MLEKNAKNLGLRSDCIGGAANGCSTRRRYPTTAHRGDFWLLGFPPGPVRLSLANLGPMGYPAGSILTTSLARTSVQRGPTRHSCPHLKPSTQSDLQAAGLQERATTPSRNKSWKYFYLITAIWKRQHDGKLSFLRQSMRYFISRLFHPWGDIRFSTFCNFISRFSNDLTNVIVVPFIMTADEHRCYHDVNIVYVRVLLEKYSRKMFNALRFLTKFSSTLNGLQRPVSLVLCKRSIWNVRRRQSTILASKFECPSDSYNKRYKRTKKVILLNVQINRIFIIEFLSSL